jgi:hypothetical protein
MLIPAFLYGKYPEVKKSCNKIITQLKKGKSFQELNLEYRDAAKEGSAIVLENVWKTNSHIEGFWMFPLASQLWKAEMEKKTNSEKIFNELVEMPWGHLAVSCGQHCYWMFPENNPLRENLYLKWFAKHTDAYNSVDGQLERRKDDPHVTEKNYFRNYTWFSGSSHILAKMFSRLEKSGYKKFLEENKFIDKTESSSEKVLLPEMFLGTFYEVMEKVQNVKNGIYKGEAIEKIVESKMIDPEKSGFRIITQDARGQDRAKRKHFHLCPLYILLREGDWGGRDAFAEKLLDSPWGTLCVSIQGGYWIHSDEKRFDKLLLKAVAKYSDVFQKLEKIWSWEDESAPHWLYKNCIPQDVRRIIARIIISEIKAEGFLPVMERYKVLE